MVPDNDVIEIPVRVLSIIFIILICLTNIILIKLQIRKPRFYENVKLMTIISLSIGDVIFALFPLVVTARMVFETDLTFMTCRLLATYSTFYNYLIHFVYGIGLVVLGAEVLLRHKIPTNFNTTSIALAVSSVPWFLGLVTVLPMCMANVDYAYSCINSQSIYAMSAVSVFFPASLAVVVTAVLNCVHFSTNQQEQSVNTKKNADVYSQENVGLPLIYTPQYNPQIITQDKMYQHYSQYPNNQQPNVNYQQGPQNYPQNITEINYHVLNVPTNLYSEEQNNTYNSPPDTYQPLTQHTTRKQEGTHQCNYNQQGVTQPTVSANVPNNQATPVVVTLPSNRHTEVQRLLIISILFFILVVPFAAINLSMPYIIWQDSSTYIVVVQIVNWVMVARSCITPLIMISYSNL